MYSIHEHFSSSAPQDLHNALTVNMFNIINISRSQTIVIWHVKTENLKYLQFNFIFNNNNKFNKNIQLCQNTKIALKIKSQFFHPVQNTMHNIVSKFDFARLHIRLNINKVITVTSNHCFVKQWNI